MIKRAGDIAIKREISIYAKSDLRLRRKGNFFDLPSACNSSRRVGSPLSRLPTAVWSSDPWPRSFPLISDGDGGAYGGANIFGGKSIVVPPAVRPRFSHTARVRSYTEFRFQCIRRMNGDGRWSLGFYVTGRRASVKEAKSLNSRPTRLRRQQLIPPRRAADYAALLRHSSPNPSVY